MLGEDQKILQLELQSQNKLFGIWFYLLKN